MARIAQVQGYVNTILNHPTASEIEESPYLHTYGVAQLCTLLAAKRSLNGELGLPVPENVMETNPSAATQGFDQGRLGDIAQGLAKKAIVGIKTDDDFMTIIKYYPEEAAFDELVDGWCAAFVYHCCQLGGLVLPIRAKDAAYRFACVVGWYDWGMKMGYCLFEKDGVTPMAGDIVIFNHIIPPERKAASSAWCDHIGIVLSCTNDTLTVAEGNADNLNVSRIMLRKRDATIGCYIRIA